MSPNYFDLAVDLPVFKEGLDVRALIKDTDRYNYQNLENFSDLVTDQFKDFFSQLGLSIFMIELFHLRPYNNTTPHIDISRGDAVKINWVFGGAGSTMNWYSELPWSKSKDKLSDADTNIIVFDHKHVRLIDRYELQGPTVVQTGIPHNITTAKEDRYCINVSVTEGLGRPTMSRAREIFSGKIRS